MPAEHAFEERVGNLLAQNGFGFQREVGVRGVVVDFVVNVGGDRWVFLETKARVTDRAWLESQAVQYEGLLGGPVAIVVPRGSIQRSSDRVIAEADVLTWIAANRSQQPGTGQAQAFINRRRPVIFVAMPIEQRFDDVFYTIATAADRADADVNRVDKSVHNGVTLAKIREGLRDCSFIVADLSEHNPNVLYELGYGHALGKASVHLCYTPRRDLPFDVRDRFAIKYQVGSVTSVLGTLVKHFKDELGT